MKQENKSKIYSQAAYWLGVVAVGLAVGLSVQFAVAWKAPTSSAPGGNLEAPINASSITQSKGAGLILNTSGIDPEGLVVANGNVGIGTTNPFGPLDIRGDLVVGGVETSPTPPSKHKPAKPGGLEGAFRIGTALTGSEYTTLDNADGPWLYFIDGIDPVWFDGSVGVRLGDKPSAKFIVGKAKNTYGPISCSKLTETSDLRYKKDIKTIENAIDRIKNIRGVDFKLRDNNDPSMGVIAQEVEKDFPSLVSENEYGYKLTNYSGFIGVLIEAVKEQQEQIEKLQEEVESLK